MQPLSPPEPKKESLENSRISIMGLDIDIIPKVDLMPKLRGYLQGTKNHAIITANSLLILESQKLPALKRACENASMVLPDSSGISWAAKQLKLLQPYRIPGIDLAFDLCREAQMMGISVFLFGGNVGVAPRAAHYLKSRFPNLLIGGTHQGFFNWQDEDKILEQIWESGSRLILVGLGMPLQELWINRIKDKLPPGISMGVGGTFDVWAGDLKRAPQWVQKSGMEWMYRLGQEPNRFNRVANLPRFAVKVLTTKYR